MKLTLIACIGLGIAPWAAAADSTAALDDALRAIAMTRADLSFRTDYADHPDSFRISVVDSLLGRPLDTESYVRRLADASAATGSLESLVRVCARQLGLDVSASHRDEVGSPTPAESPPHVLDVLLPAVRIASGEIEAAFAGLSREELAFVHAHAPVLLQEEEFDPEKPIDEREREAEEEDELGDELLLIAANIDYARIANAGATLARAVDLALSIGQERGFEPPAAAPGSRAAPGPAWGDVLSVTETDVGTVVVGGPGTTVYEGGCAIVIDLGGDDVYMGDVGGTGPGRAASVVIDVAGDDVYRAGDHSLGAGFVGVGILVDLAGDDAYTAGNFSLGSGLFGVGVLLDREGSDSYSGDTCTEGSGAFGIGIHLDEEGNDSYHAALFSQAFGFVEGVGLLRDDAGNDLYFAGGKYTDEIRYFDHFLSLSQGFGFGWRPDASGGIGLLLDGAGNDVYVSDIFGQGSSYWFAVGGLVDLAGNDHYVSYQYAQGAGTHITVAALVDAEGDDNYISKGVSQGCGHDLAIGILHDLSGDDNYTCHDLSQAAGNANGIGVLIDDEGNDSYSVRDPDNTHGYGNLRRDYGSVGIFIDCGGSDAYSGRGRDDAWWSASTHGIGVDTDAVEEAP